MSVVKFQPKASRDKDQMLEFVDWLREQVENGELKGFAMAALLSDGLTTFYPDTPEGVDMAQISVAVRQLDMDILNSVGFDR